MIIIVTLPVSEEQKKMGIYCSNLLQTLNRNLIVQFQCLSSY